MAAGRQRPARGLPGSRRAAPRPHAGGRPAAGGPGGCTGGGDKAGCHGSPGPRGAHLGLQPSAQGGPRVVYHDQHVPLHSRAQGNDRSAVLDLKVPAGQNESERLSRRASLELANADLRRSGLAGVLPSSLGDDPSEPPQPAITGLPPARLPGTAREAACCSWPGPEDREGSRGGPGEGGPAPELTSSCRTPGTWWPRARPPRRPRRRACSRSAAC